MNFPVMKIGLALLVVSIAVSPAGAQQLKPEDDVFNEKVLPEAEISGAVVMGLQVRKAEAGRHDVRTRLPSDMDAEALCLRATSLDGRYSAAATYPLPDAAPAGEVDIAYPTRHADLITRAPGDDLAIAISAGRCDGGAEGRMFLTTWNATEGDTRLLVNSFDADAVFLYVGDALTPVECEPLDGLAYDVSCRLGDTPAGAVQLEIVRIVGGNPMPSTFVDAWFDDG